MHITFTHTHTHIVHTITYIFLNSDLWRWTYKHRKAIQQASESYHAAKEMAKPGNVPMLVWHDENDSFECKGAIPGISVINSLSKDYPISGKYAGGMILRLYFGIGVGIAFTKSQVKKLLNGHHFKDATRMYESPSSSLSASQLPPKQRREAKAAKVSELVNKKQKRKQKMLMLESHNTAKSARIEGSRALANNKKCSSCSCQSITKKKLTFDEAKAKVIAHARSPSNVVSCAGRDDSSLDQNANLISVDDGLEEYWTLGDDGIVKSWCGPLKSYDMTGWRRVRGGFIRPTPAYPCQGMAIRETSTKFEWKPGMNNKMHISTSNKHIHKGSLTYACILI